MLLYYTVYSIDIHYIHNKQSYIRVYSYMSGIRFSIKNLKLPINNSHFVLVLLLPHRLRILNNTQGVTFD